MSVHPVTDERRWEIGMGGLSGYAVGCAMLAIGLTFAIAGLTGFRDAWYTLIPAYLVIGVSARHLARVWRRDSQFLSLSDKQVAWGWTRQKSSQTRLELANLARLIVSWGDGECSTKIELLTLGGWYHVIPVDFSDRFGEEIVEEARRRGIVVEQYNETT